MNLDEPHTRQTLEIYVCNKLIDTSNIPVSFQPTLEKYWNPLLLCLTFPKHAPHYLRELTVDHLHMQPNALDIVGDIINQNRDLQNYIRIEAKEILKTMLGIPKRGKCYVFYWVWGRILPLCQIIE